MKTGLTAGGGMLLGMVLGMTFGYMVLGMIFGLIIGSAAARRQRSNDVRSV